MRLGKDPVAGCQYDLVAKDEDIEFDPRVTLHHADGRTEPVPADAVLGLDAFVQGWRDDVDEPHSLTLGGWQMADDAHPVGSGRPGYRLVRKTVRTVVVPSIAIVRPNLRIGFVNESITLGEPRFPGALRGRQEGHFLLPQWGSVRYAGKSHFKYDTEPELPVELSAHQESTPVGNFVEVLYALDEEVPADYDSMIAAGRAAVAPLTVMLDLMYGNRLLGPVVTEEVGEVHDDWHWNRQLGGRRIALEAQANLRVIDALSLSLRLELAIETQISRDAASKARMRVASQWYWTAEAEADPVQKYIGYWLVLEALELGEGSNIKPLRESLSTILGVSVNAVKVPLGRLYGTRSGLVHGSVRSLDLGKVAKVRALAIALLEYHTLNFVSPTRTADVADALGLHRRSEGPGPSRDGPSAVKQ